MKSTTWATIGLAALLLAGCASQDIPDPEPDSGMAGADDGGFADTGGFDDAGMGDLEEFSEDMGDGELTMVIYFDFDQSELRPEYADLLARHATRLANDSRMNVRLEGRKL